MGSTWWQTSSTTLKVTCLAWHRNISSNRVSTNIVFCFSFLLHKFPPPFLSIPSGHWRMRRLREAFILNLEGWELNKRRPGLLFSSYPYFLTHWSLLLPCFLCVGCYVSSSAFSCLILSHYLLSLFSLFLLSLPVLFPDASAIIERTSFFTSAGNFYTTAQDFLLT